MVTWPWTKSIAISTAICAILQHQQLCIHASYNQEPVQTCTAETRADARQNERERLTRGPVWRNSSGSLRGIWATSGATRCAPLTETWSVPRRWDPARSSWDNSHTAVERLPQNTTKLTSDTATTKTHLTALYPGRPGWAGTIKKNIHSLTPSFSPFFMVHSIFLAYLSDPTTFFHNNTPHVCKRSSGWINYDNYIHITQPNLYLTATFRSPTANFVRHMVTWRWRWAHDQSFIWHNVRTISTYVTVSL